VPNDDGADKELSAEEQEKLARFKHRLEVDKKIASRMALIRHKVLVASGKGGVGKTATAVNVSLALAAAGDRVALLDADIHGPGVPLMLGMADVRPTGSGGGINPVAYNENLVVMSMAFLITGDADAVIWRGPLKMAMIDNFLADVNWGERDWLVADTPPGTGDEILSLAQRIKNVDGLIMVTTAQAAAVASARKSLTFAVKTGVPILGVVENMAPFACSNCGHEVRPVRRRRRRARRRGLRRSLSGRCSLRPGGRGGIGLGAARRRDASREPGREGVACDSGQGPGDGEPRRRTAKGMRPRT